jgi:nicotinamidase-related amidase
LAEGAILATALGLLARQKNVTVLRDATGTLDKKAGRKALNHIRAKGANVILTEKRLGPSALDHTKVHC